MSAKSRQGGIQGDSGERFYQCALFEAYVMRKKVRISSRINMCFLKQRAHREIPLTVVFANQAGDVVVYYHIVPVFKQVTSETTCSMTPAGSYPSVKGTRGDKYHSIVFVAKTTRS